MNNIISSENCIVTVYRYLGSNENFARERRDGVNKPRECEAENEQDSLEVVKRYDLKH